MHYERYLFHQMNTNMHATSYITNNKTTKQKYGMWFYNMTVSFQGFHCNVWICKYACLELYSIIM